MPLDPGSLDEAMKAMRASGARCVRICSRSGFTCACMGCG